MPINVGAAQRDYNATRNILSSPVPDVERIRAGNLFRYPNHALFKGFNRIDPMLGNLHWARGNCDLLHFFNMLSLGRTPWITTFETALPRWHHRRPGAVRFGLRLLAGRSCRRLIAMSECAHAIQKAVLADHPDMAAEIEAKVTVVHPPQRPLVDREKPAPVPSEPIRFAIVGADFFRKGGREILRAFDRLLARGAPIELTIVSTMQYGDYASRTTREDLEHARRLIAKWPRHIVHHERLPNERVLELFRRSHVALLPSWADTYGYSVLEAQAAGCPVVSTDVRALPEINGEACGWMIAVPKSDRGDAVIGTAEERARFSALLEAGIEAAIDAMLADLSTIATRGAAALERIRTQHCPDAHGRRLRAIYEEALG